MLKYAVCGLAILLLSHASYSALQQIRIQRNQESGNQSLPFDIILECLISIVVMLFGLIISTKNFKDISIEESSQKSRIEVIKEDNNKQTKEKINIEGKEKQSEIKEKIEIKLIDQETDKWEKSKENKIEEFAESIKDLDKEQQDKTLSIIQNNAINDEQKENANKLSNLVKNLNNKNIFR